MICQKVGPLGGQAETIRWKARGWSIALATSVREEEEERISLWRANSGRDLFPAKLCRHVPRNFFFPLPPPCFAREEDRWFRFSMRNGYLSWRIFILFYFSNGFIFHLPDDDSFEFKRWISSTSTFEARINRGEKLTVRVAPAEKLFQLGEEEKREEKEKRKMGTSVREVGIRRKANSLRLFFRRKRKDCPTLPC